MSLCLRVTPSADEPFDYRGGSDVVIGRSKTADLSLPGDRFLSKRHARVFEDTGAWYVEDLGSTNTTLLNGQPVERRMRVFAGDVLRLSDCRIEVGFDSPPEEPTAIYRPAAAVLEQTDSQERLDETPGEPTLKRVAERLALLNDVHRALALPKSRSEIFDLVLERAVTHLKAEEGIVFLENDDGSFDRAAVRRTRRLAGDYIYSRRLIDRVATKGMAALVHDVREDDRFCEAKSLVSQGVRSLVAAPLHHLGGRAGMIVLATRAVVRKFNQDDMELLVSLASIAGLAMRSLELIEEASQRRALEKELALARQIQVNLFPDRLPTIPGYELFASNRPSRTVSGDLYRVEARNRGGEYVLLVADVSGKGIGASLLTASLEALAMGPIEMGRGPDEICNRLSRRLYARTPLERFATAVLAVLDVESGRIRYTNAGHNPALVLRAGGDIEELPATGAPLGLIPDTLYAAEQVTLALGDAIVIYTDGVTEARSPAGEEYALRRLTEVCREHRTCSARALGGAIAADLDAFTAGVPYEDDRTIVIAKRTRPWSRA